MAAQVAESLKTPEEPKAAPPAPAVAVAVEPAPAKTTREGKRFLGYYVEPLRHEEIKQAALDEGIQIQELLRQAVDAWMDANGAEAVAAVERRRARKAGR
jgi:hypothetical protein